MQQVTAVETVPFVTNSLRTGHLDGSYGVCDGGGRGQQVGAALDYRVAGVGEIAIGGQQLDDGAEPLPVGVEVGVVGFLRRREQGPGIFVAAERGLEFVIRAPDRADRIDLER